MTDHISIDRERLCHTLNEMRSTGISSALTTTIIDRYMGGFHSNKEVPVNISWNAQFGKYLKSHSTILGIFEEAKKEKVIINGNPTSSSRWALN